MGQSQSTKHKLDNIASLLQGLLECHGNDLRVMRVIVETINARYNENELIKSQHVDVKQTGIWEREGFDLIQYLLSFLLNRLACAEKSFEKIKFWSGTGISKLKSKPTTWKDLIEQLIASSYSSPSDCGRNIQEPLNKTHQDTDEVNKRHSKDPATHRFILDDPCNSVINDDSLNDSLTALEESDSRLREFICKYEENDKKCWKMANNLEQQIAQKNKMKGHAQFDHDGARGVTEVYYNVSGDDLQIKFSSYYKPLLESQRKILCMMLDTTDTQRNTNDLPKTQNEDEPKSGQHSSKTKKKNKDKRKNTKEDELTGGHKHDNKTKKKKKSKRKNTKVEILLVLQLYYDRDDDIMKKVGRSMDDIMKQNLKECKIDATIEYCKTPEQLKPYAPVLVLCFNTSKIVTDLSNAIKGVDFKERRNVALIAFYNTDVTFAPIAKTAIVGPQFDGIAGVHHMAFLNEKGVYECKDNTDAINDIVSFIKANNDQFCIA